MASNFLGNDSKTIAVDVWCKYIINENVRTKDSCACSGIYTLFDDILFNKHPLLIEFEVCFVGCEPSFPQSIYTSPNVHS